MMRSAVSMRKAFGRLISLQSGSRPLIRYSENYGVLEGCVQKRWWSGIVGTEKMLVNKDNKACKDISSFCVSGCSSSAAVQRRGFLGCGDGEEGNMVSKLYEERRILGYSPEQLFNVVAAVDLYQDFLPWCQRSDIVRRYPDGSFDAELEIGFKFLVESYVSHVEWKKPTYVKSTASESALFDHLINVWEFSLGPNPGTCNVYFFVDFKFQSPLYRQMASVFFKEVVSRLVSSFHERCRQVYGPEVSVLENTHDQRA